MSLKGWKSCDGHFLFSSILCLFSVDELIVSFFDLQAALEALRSEMTEKEKSMENEIEALRKAGRDRERDLDTLNAVLQCNQDVISVRPHTVTATGVVSCLAVPPFLFDTRLEMQDKLGEYKTILSSPLMLFILQACSFIHCIHTDLFIWLHFISFKYSQLNAKHSRTLGTSVVLHVLEALSVFDSGPAGGSGREGATAEGGGEREGIVEAEGRGPHCCPAGEGGSDPHLQRAAGERGGGNTPAAKQTSLKVLLLLSCGLKTQDI